MTLRALAPLLGLALTGCGLVTITTSTNGSTSPGGAAGDAGNAGASSGLGADARKAFDGWTYASCASNEWCGVKLAGAAGVRPDGQNNGQLANPKGAMPNPDAEWLPGWDSLAADENGARDVWEALNLAASNRTWSAECKKRYAEAKPGLDARQKAVPEALKKAMANPDRFERLRALLQLETRAKGNPPNEGPFAPGFDAAAFDTERAVLDAFRAEKKLWVFDREQLQLSAGIREVLAPRWSAEDEELAFCARAAKRGFGDLPALPPPHSPYTDHVVKLVKPVFTDAELESIDQKTAARKVEAQKALSVDDPNKPKQSPSQTQFDDAYTIKSFTAGKDGGVSMKLFRKSTYESGGSHCVSALGLPVPCPVMHVTKLEDITVHFADFPAGLKLEQGDSYDFYSELTKTGATGRGTPVERWTQEYEALHLFSVTKKGGKPVGYWK